jgi:hypothetical protein
MLYPLSYEGGGWRKPGAKTGSICAAIKRSCGGPPVWEVIGERGAGFGRFFAISGAPDSAVCGERVRSYAARVSGSRCLP